MEYIESDDFREKEIVIATMLHRMEKHQVSLEGARILEIGGAGGVLGGLLSAYASKVIVTDIIDTQIQYEGQFAKLLKEKFQRNDRHMDLARIEFQVVDAMDLPYKDRIFNWVVSNNAFEHIPDPFAALKEALRVTKEGGIVYLTFDPIWTADTGNHFAHYVPEPWAHLLCSSSQFIEQMEAAGASSTEIVDFIHGMNRVTCTEYRDRISKVLDAANVNAYEIDSWSGCANATNTSHPNLELAANRLQCDKSDLLVRGFCVTVVV